MAKRKPASLALAVRGEKGGGPDVVGTDPIVAEARERWQRASEKESAQRERMLAAKKFRAGDQWDPEIKAARQGKTALQAVAAQPPRPCLTIDRLSQPVRLVSNQIKTADFGFDVVPNGSGADQETADIFKGYFRRVQNQARSEQPIEWAADGALEGGIGWFRVRTEYVQQAPDQADEGVFDQECRLERIPNNLAVYCDPSSLHPTRRNAQWMFVTEDLAKDDFGSRWPKANMRGLEEFTDTGTLSAWVTEHTIRIAEYWRVTYTEERWAMMPDGSIKQVEDFPKDAKAKRLVRRPKVEGFKINAIEVLEQWDWLGSRIPLIPVLGEELNIDGECVLRGVIEEGMDAQRMVNYTYSGAMEIYALGSKSPYIAAVGSVDNYKQIWETANWYNHAYLPYDAFDEEGHQMPPPEVLAREAPIQASVALMQVSEEAIKATTGIYDPTLGKPDTRHVSGRAVQAIQGQAEVGNANWPDNVVRALIEAGEVMLEVLPKITRPGQILHVLGLDDEPESVIVGQHFVDQQGTPMPVDQNHPDVQQGIAQFYDLTKGRYAVTVVAGKAMATKREEGAAALGELIPHLPPELAAVATPDYVEQLDFPNSHKIAEKLRKALPPALQGEGEDGQDHRLMAAMQQIQQLQQQLQSKVAEKQAEAQAKGQVDLAKTQVQEQAETQRALMDRQTQLDKAEIAANAQIAVAEVKSGQEDFDRRLKLIELFLTADKEARLERDQRTHEHVQNELDRRHEKELASQEHVQALQQGQQSHEAALEQGAQAAALKPEPSSNGH